MAACSADYLALVKTVSGLTPESPYALSSFFGVTFDVPNPGAYSEWRQLAQVLAAKMYTRFTELGEVETARVQKGEQTSYPKWNDNVVEVNRIYNEAHALPDSLEAIADTKWWSDHIAEASQLAIDAACQMERLDYAIVEYGVTPPGLPTLPGLKPVAQQMGLIDKALVVGGVALVGVGVFYIIRASRKSAAAAPSPAQEAA